MYFAPNRLADHVTVTSIEVASPAVAPESPSPPRTGSRIVAACFSHATRDFVGQSLGRLLGLGTYSLLSTLNETPLRISCGIVGAASGGRLAYLIARQQIGTDSYAQCTAVGACAVVGALAGGMIAGLGSNQIVAGFAASSLLTAAVSVTSSPACDATAAKDAGELKAGTAMATSFAAIGVAHWCDHQWVVGSRFYPARNLGLAVESSMIEICKSSFEHLGPSVNRNALNFEGKVVAALLGMAPYVAATVLLNAYVSSLLQPRNESSAFAELATPMIVGGIANALRGATNACVVFKLHSRSRFVANEDVEILKDHAGAQWPTAETVLNKACVRYLLSACRNAVYARLRDSGMSVAQASEIAQGVYACYAQCRDLIHDVARGEGWSEPRIRIRAEAAPA
jgi:hypothetical protein